MESGGSGLTPQVIKREQIIDAPSRETILRTKMVGGGKGVTPSVLNLERLKIGNTSATTVTNLVNGQEGQEVAILGDGFSTMQHGTKIMNNTGADKLLAANKVYRYTKFDGVWIEDA